MKKYLKRAAWIALAIGLVSAVVFYLDLREQAQIGAGYVAHQVCSCVFVADREHAACLPDMMPIMDRIQSEIVETNDGTRVRAWIPLLAERSALHTPGRGCALD